MLASSTGGATLTITGGGSLNASGSVNSGIYVQSNTGNGTLAITGAKVTASSSKGANGVHIQCGVSSNASLTVNGGSLTATATGSNSGINFLFGSGVSGSGTPSLNVSNSAIVKASGDTGGITSNSSPVTPSGTGIVFNNGTGTVYGDVTLQEDITINQGESLTIRDGASLNTGDNKVTVNGGTLNGEDKITGTVKYTPSITTASLPEGKVNEEYDAFLTADGSEPIEWSVIQEDSLPTGLSLSKGGKITGKPTAPGDYVFTVTASNDVGSVSKELTITVKDVDPIYSIQNSGDINFTDAIEGYTPEVKTIMIKNDGNQPITLDQPSSTSFDVGTLSKTELNVGETAEFTVQPKNGLLAGSYEEDIVITGTNNGKSVSTKVNVKFNVKHNAVKVERKDPTCTEKGNIEYWYCEACRKYFQDEALTKELKQEETILPATGHNLTKVDEKKPTVDAAGNIEYWYCKVCDKYFSDEKAEHEITLEDTIIAKLPKFVSGANQEWTRGSKDGLTFKIDTDIKEFKKVLVDGKELKDTDYDIKSGSTILTLKPSFLDTLSAGKHKIRFEFNTGSVEAYFTVKDKENSSQTESANTGVQNKYGLWIVLLLVAAGGLAGFGILSKRRKNHK
ncbi:hypothetical protein [Faecalitalea cylindroides]|uniref:COG1470 family protein n=1 Tax=Faecalitalea cylindroides TaxID=39483 RepID=UPI00242E0DC5|nr:hypothetical protein [Faecalitalea cylindroides]